MRNFSTHVSAPGRIILFGEHAVNYGGIGLAVAVEHRVHCMAKVDSSFMVNGEELDPEKHRYTRGAVLQGWTDMDKPLSIQLDSQISDGMGLGKTAASTVACLGAISMMHDHLIFEELARNAFEVQHGLDSWANPLDVAASTHGRGVAVLPGKHDGDLWAFSGGEDNWSAFDIDVKELVLVLGYTGIPALEERIISKVNRFYQQNSFARDIMSDLCHVASLGYEAVKKGDLERTGKLMSKYHKLLLTLGAGHHELDKLVRAVSRYSYGAKLTGAGGGGCVVALAHDPEGAAEAIDRAGGTGLVLKIAERGIQLED